MRTIAVFFLPGIFLLVLSNYLYSQALLKEDGSSYNPCSVFETVNGSRYMIGMGVTNSNVKAKLHLLWTPVLSRPAVKVDVLTNSNDTIGTCENWRCDGTRYYGFFQSYKSSVIQNPKTINNYFQNNLGLNILTPSYQLDINGIIGCSGNNATGMNICNANQPFVFQYTTIGTGGAIPDGFTDGGEQEEEDTVVTTPLTIYSWGVKVQNYLESTSQIITNSLKIKSNPFTGSLFMCNNSYGNGAWTDTSVISINEGRVGIGTVNRCSNYKLAVNGKIICEEMKVRLRSQWPDHVFDRDYALLPIKEVEKFIKANKHLPEMPGAEEVAENGINNGEMNALLLKKIEELTLYVIALEKKVEQLKRSSDSIKN